MIIYFIMDDIIKELIEDLKHLHHRFIYDEVLHELLTYKKYNLIIQPTLKFYIYEFQKL
jgi:hypothetical protein